MQAIASLFLALWVPAVCWAETIDVTIKGVDDGVKTTRQQDYDEALMNAKLQAIERAGVEIESLVKIVNFQLKFQTVEQRAKAVLLPGFQVVDIGYTADGTYQVVLSGKLQVGEKRDERQALIFLDNDFMLDGMKGKEFPGAVPVDWGYIFAVEPKVYTLKKRESEEKVFLKPDEVRITRFFVDDDLSFIRRATRKIYYENYGTIVVDGRGSTGLVKVGNCKLRRDYNALFFLCPRGDM